MTLHALPPNVTHERRELDRRFPATALTVTQDSGRVFWVLTGKSEFLADSAAHQRLVISTHNANRHFPGDSPVFKHYRSQS